MTVTYVPLIASPKGFAKPKHAEYHVFWGAREVRLYFKQQLGVTFDLALPVSITLPETWAELNAKLGTNSFAYWRDAMAAFEARGSLRGHPNSMYRLYYFRPFSALKVGGGTVGMHEFGSYSIWPRTSCRGDYKNLLMCGYSVAKVRALGFEIPWWDDGRNPKSILGGDAHETVHHLVDHSHDFSAPRNAQGWPELTTGYGEFPNVYIVERVAQALRESGYLS